jgi:dihydrofolate reductase
MSHKAIEISANLQATVSASAETPLALMQRLAGEGAKHLYVDGGITIQGFLAAGLIDEITITLIPIILGSGKSLFGPLAADISLRLLENKAYPNGFVQVKYQVSKSA